MKIQDILSFDKESYFNGAVQADWFYDERKAQMISSAYVFHGPRYFGVGEKDIDSSQHKLLDTARFAELIADKGKKQSNNFIMTIAGYGMGKSHLAVTLGCLFSGHNTALQDSIINNIDQVDKSIAKKIRANVEGTKNLIIVLNGMNNFNLDYEILSCVRKALSQHGIDENILQDVTKAYSVAHHFLLQTFDLMHGQYVEYSRKHNLSSIPEASLKDYLAASVETDERAFNVIDEVFNLTNGHRIQWENGLSAKEIISFVEKKFIIESKTFERIIIIFDEFGRFLEYAAQHPNEAGDSALQQIFETIQNSNGRILHIAFIQSELSAYLKRIDKTGNIERYVGRYEASDKYYLSSNFETILANLIKGKDKKEFTKYIRRPFFQNKRYYSSMQQALNRWVKGSNEKYVWSNEDAFINVVCEGCYPLHPYTTWILGNLSNWMQQRSTISFAAEMFEQIKGYIVRDDDNFAPSIRPSDIIESSIFHEMVNSEEKGMVQSEYCLLYQSIITKLKDQITDKEKNVLNAVLITNIGRFECFDQNDAVVAVSYCACLSKAETAHHLDSLEKQYGVVTFNAAAKRYVLVAEATGRNDYQRALLKKRMLTYKRTDLSAVDEDIEKYLKLDVCIETPFALENNISGYEWRFEKRLIDVSDLNTRLHTWVTEFETAYDAEHTRGLLIFAYDNCQDDTTGSIVSIFNEHKLSDKPIVIIVLKDRDNQLIECLEMYSALKAFSTDEKTKYATFFNPELKNCMFRIGQVFNSLQAEKKVVSGTGIQTNSLRLTSICNERFKTCFSKAISFNFDGFEKKLTSTVRKYVNEVANNLGNQTVIDTTSFNMLAPDVKNRIKGLLFDGNAKSWKIINNNLTMHMPQNASVAEIFTTSYEVISCKEKVSLRDLFFKYLLSPYGMNQYALTLLIFSFLGFYKDGVVIERDGEKINLSAISSFVFNSAKLQLQTLLKLNVRLIVKTDNDLISSLCENIVNNQSVEKCPRLQEQLYSTLEKGDVPEELWPAISAAKNKLQEGENIAKALEKRMEEVDDGIQQLKNKFALRLAVTLLDKLDNCEGAIGENTSYVYSYIFTENSRKLQSELKKMIEVQGDHFVQRMGCNDITQLSQFENVYKKIAEKLVMYGFSQLAEEVLQRIEYVKSHVVTEQRYQTVLVDYERYKKAKLPLNARREECNQAIQAAAEWISFWKNATDYDSGKREAFVVELTEEVEQISELINNKEKNMITLLEGIPQITEENQMYSVMRKLEQDLSFGFDTSVIEKANYFLDKEAAYTSFWDGAAKSYSDFIQSSSLFEEEEWYVLPFSNFVEYRRQYIEQQYQEKAIQWMQKHPLPSEQELEGYSERETEQLVSSLKVMPDYLSEKYKKRVNDFLEVIYAKNEKGKVLSIERSFMELSKQNQQECIARLTVLFNTDDIPERSKEYSSETEQNYNKPKVRNVEFTEDEMILLLHVYMLHRDEWFTAQKEYVIELSDLYRSLPIHSDDLRTADNFRNPAGIDMQLRSLAKCDPTDYHRQKLVASTAMRKVWNEYANNKSALHVKVTEIIQKYGIDTSRYPALF